MNVKLSMNWNIQLVTQQVNLILNSVQNYGQYILEKSKIKFDQSNLLWFALLCRWKYEGQKSSSSINCEDLPLDKILLLFQAVCETHLQVN